MGTAARSKRSKVVAWIYGILCLMLLGNLIDVIGGKASPDIVPWIIWGYFTYHYRHSIRHYLQEDGKPAAPPHAGTHRARPAASGPEAPVHTPHGSLTAPHQKEKQFQQL